MLMGGVSNAQTTATDFTAIDCTGGSRSLFTDLNNGKVVILAWVMPCSGCVNGVKAADSAAHSLAVQYPQGVSLYIITDGPPNDCNTLHDWIAANQISRSVTFDNINNDINQDNYGGFGMPHIVVIGPDRVIYFNEKNGSGFGVQDAVQNAINVATKIGEILNDTDLVVAPNPVAETLSINYFKPITRVFILSLNGQIVKEQQYANGKQHPVVDLSCIPNGLYSVKLIDVAGNIIIRKFIKN